MVLTLSGFSDETSLSEAICDFCIVEVFLDFTCYNSKLMQLVINTFVSTTYKSDCRTNSEAGSC